MSTIRKPKTKNLLWVLSCTVVYESLNSQWRRDWGEELGTISPPTNFWVVGKLWRNVLLVGKFSSKIAKFGVEKPLCENLWAKLKFWYLIMSSIGNLQSVSIGKLQFLRRLLFATDDAVCDDVKYTRYCTAGVDKRVRSTRLYHCRQCSILLTSRSDLMDYTVVCFMTNDCRRTLWKQSTSASWVWFTCWSGWRQHAARVKL